MGNKLGALQYSLRAPESILSFALSLILASPFRYCLASWLALTVYCPELNCPELKSNHHTNHHTVRCVVVVRDVKFYHEVTKSDQSSFSNNRKSEYKQPCDLSLSVPPSTIFPNALPSYGQNKHSSCLQEI